MTSTDLVVLIPWPGILDSSKESSHVQLSPSLSELSPSLSPSCVRAVSPSCLRAVSPCDCMAADLVRAVVADGSASGREPPRVVLILTWGACGGGSDWV
jgi:hypothetical protein